MRIKLKTTVASPDLCASAGQIIDVNPSMAGVFVEAGCAEYIDFPAPEEKQDPVAPKQKRGRNG